MTAGPAIGKPVAPPTTRPAAAPRHVARTEALWATVTALVAFATGAASLRLWSWVPGNPFGLTGDKTQISMQLKDIYDHGWYWHNADLAFPFGQNGSWFPELNVIHVALIRVLDLFFASPFTGGVVFFVLSWPLTGITGYLLARSQGLNRWAGFLLGVLLANAPGHQERFGHLYLAAYWVVPVAMWLVLEVARARPLLSRDGAGRVRWRGGRTLLTIAAVLLVGWSGVYYAGFTLVLLAAVTLARRVLAHGPRGFLQGAGVIAAIGAVAAVPLLVARLATRSDVVTGGVPARRTFTEAEAFAGKLMDLVLPWPDHRLEPLAYLTWGYRSVTDATVEVSALGIVGAVGMVSLLCLTVVALLGGRPMRGDLGRWSALTLLSLGLFTVGGLGSFIAFFFTAQVRTWSRISLYILVLALLVVGYWLTRMERRRGGILVGVVTVAVVSLGVLDQTNPAVAPDHAAIEAEMTDLGRYTDGIVSGTEPGCPVFQAPVIPYPETHGLGTMDFYDQLKPYLASHDLRFSGGGMKGTAAADWQLGIESADPTALAEDLVAVGFCALEVDTRGFADPEAELARLGAVYGSPVSSTGSGEFVAFDIRGAGSAGRNDESLRTRTLHPVIVSLRAYGVEEVDGATGQYLGPTGGLEVANLGDHTVPVRISITVAGVGPETRTVTVQQDGRTVASSAASEQAPARLSMTLDAAPGVTTLRITTDGPAVKDEDTQRTLAAWTSRLEASSPADVRVVTTQEQVASGWVAQ